MAFADSLGLKNVAGVSRTFSRTTFDQNGQRSIYIDESTTGLEPRLMRIAHRVEAYPGLAGITRERHTIEFLHTKKDATLGILTTGACTLSLVLPRAGAVVRADLDDMVSFLKTANPDGFLTSTTYMDKLFRGEI